MLSVNGLISNLKSKYAGRNKEDMRFVSSFDLSSLCLIIKSISSFL